MQTSADRADIESRLAKAISTGLAETGLFDTGSEFVVAQVLADGQLAFTWHGLARDIADIEE